MKRYLTTVILLTAILCFSINNAAYSNNPAFTKKPDKSFKISSKTRTIEMKKGETYQMKMNLKDSRLYYISVKGKKSLGCIQFKIIDPNNNNEIIFDNSAYEFNKNMTFLNDVDRKVIIEIRTMPCCYNLNNKTKQKDVKFLFANKKIKKNEEFNINNNYNLYAIN